MVLRKISSQEETITKSFIAFLSILILTLNFVIYRDTYSYSYVGINLSAEPLEITIDAASESKDMIYQPKSGKCTKIIQPGEMESIIHIVADPAAESFIKKIQVSFRSLD